MKLVIINNRYNQKCEELLVRASKLKKLSVDIISAKTSIFSISDNSQNEDILLYRIAVDPIESLLEQMYIENGAKSFLEGNDYSKLFPNKLTRYFEFQKIGLPVPKTIFSMALDDESLLDIIDKLGLPLVIKTLDGTRGRGTLIVDSFFALKSLVELLVSKGIVFLYQEFLGKNIGISFRLVVLDNEVVCAHKRELIERSDFRTNATKKVIKQAFQPDFVLQELGKKALKARGRTFGAVDILLNNNGEYVITEVNHPFNFSVAQEISGIDIAGLMVQSLVSKVEKNKSSL